LCEYLGVSSDAHFEVLAPPSSFLKSTSKCVSLGRAGNQVRERASDDGGHLFSDRRGRSGVAVYALLNESFEHRNWKGYARSLDHLQVDRSKKPGTIRPNWLTCVRDELGKRSQHRAIGLAQTRCR